MTKNHVQYLTDTIKGIPLKQQAKKRNVTTASQSSVLKTAMRNLLKERSVRADKKTFDIIAHDKKVQHLNRHQKYWQIALDNYLAANVKSSLQTNAHHVKYRVPSFQSIASDNISNLMLFDDNKNSEQTSNEDLMLYPKDFAFAFNDFDDLLMFCSDNPESITPYQAAMLAFNTIVIQYDVYDI
jgi:hypothetical protein